MRRNLFLIFLLFVCLRVPAQEKSSVQVKAFDPQLKPLANVEIAINGTNFFLIGARGIAIVDIPQEDLPPKSVTLKNIELEAESWNYSKGVLEIIVRKKSYRLVGIFVRLANGDPVDGADVTFQGQKIFRGKTDSQGKLELPLPLTEKISGQTQFTIGNYSIRRFQNGEKECTIYVAAPVIKESVAAAKKEPADPFQNFELDHLDSIRSLTVFYAVFKNYDMGNLKAEDKARIDTKFKELILQLEDSLRTPTHGFLGRISDSSFVGEDVRNLLAQAEAEKQTLDYLKTSFDEKIQVLNEKLADGGGNLDAETRGKLLSDINKLEAILRQNEQKFYKNQTDYRQVLNSLKEKFFDIEDLENRLLMSEAQREEERVDFQKKIFTIFSVTLAFAVITVMLVYFSNRLKKQKKQLEIANAEVKRINENLEGIVSERTELLESAHREMDIFLYKASHDLRGPICSIIGLCNIASRTVNGAESLELVQKTSNTAFAMDRMLKKLKVISEINQPSNYSLVMLDEQISGVRQEFGRFIRDNNVRIKVECPAAISFHSFPNLVEVILRNLVENALFFSTIKKQENPEVRIKATHQKNFVELVVEDNGIGIDDAIKSRIWDMFFIGSEASTGNGLGLYIVRKSIHALQGTILVESEKDVFTRVTVHIPFRDLITVPPRREQFLLESQESS